MGFPLSGRIPRLPVQSSFRAGRDTKLFTITFEELQLGLCGEI